MYKLIIWTPVIPIFCDSLFETIPPLILTFIFINLIIKYNWILLISEEKLALQNALPWGLSEDDRTLAHRAEGQVHRYAGNRLGGGEQCRQVSGQV